jgi:phosphate:Na+ symporter
MNIFDFLTLIGGLSLFLFGMKLMGDALEKRAGSKLKTILGKITSKKISGFLLGLGVTAVIQSSSATTVMLVGFVNSGLISLTQAINVIMGANVGTTVTAWLLSLTGISGDSVWIQLLKPTSFTPILALIGISFNMFSKDDRKKDTGMIMLGFATLMFGMETMTTAVAGLKDVPEFRNILLMFSNPILGVLAGAVLTGIIQSSSASVGILQALSATGSVTYGAALPIIMGQNIGTCVTALLSSVGTNKNARRVAIVHLSFNVIGTIVLLSLYCILNAIFKFPIVYENIDQVGIAIIHTSFNVLCTAMLLPLSSYLEKLSRLIVRDSPEQQEETPMLDERLLTTPPIAIERSRAIAVAMAEESAAALNSAAKMFDNYDSAAAETIRYQEKKVDEMEDMLGTYLVKLSERPLSAEDSGEAAKLLHEIGDLERISDHAVNILESAEEKRDKGLAFSADAERELAVMTAAVNEILDLSLRALRDGDLAAAERVEPLQRVIDTLKEQMRTRHVLRMQRGKCSMEMGFIFSDLLTSFERVAGHCANIAGCEMQMAHASLELHEYSSDLRAGDHDYAANYAAFASKYALVAEAV